MLRLLTALLVILVLQLSVTADTADTVTPSADSHATDTQTAGGTADHQTQEDFDFSDFFGDDNIEDDEHLQHHLKEDVGLEKNVENMTESEKDWYYFRLHDADGDFRLDGLEILKAWQHHYLEHMGHDDKGHMEQDPEEMRKWVETQNATFVTMVDSILETQDINKDGYLDYFEYYMAKEKAREDAEKQKKEEGAPPKVEKKE